VQHLRRLPLRWRHNTAAGHLLGAVTVTAIDKPLAALGNAKCAMLNGAALLRLSPVAAGASQGNCAHRRVAPPFLVRSPLRREMHLHGEQGIQAGGTAPSAVAQLQRLLGRLLVIPEREG